MKGKLNYLRLTAFLALASAAFGASQTMNAPSQQSQPESIRPGEVNYIEGQVDLNGSSLESNTLRSTVIQPGGDLSTGQGYAEVLLAPGTFLRIGNNSEIRLVSAGLVNSRITLIRGSALVEAADVVKGSTVNVGFAGSSARIDEKGLYSLDAANETVRVFDGKLHLAEGTAGETTLKKGDQVVLTSDNPLKKRDFKTKAAQEDPLYVWSKVRSHDEAEASVNVASEFENSGGWNGPGWYWDPAWSFYAFAPGYGYLGGPFGWNYYSPAFLYGGFWGGRYYDRGFYGRGFYGHGSYGHGYYGHNGYVAGGRGFHNGGMTQFHSTGGMHSMSAGGGFHGGGFHGGGGHR